MKEMIKRAAALAAAALMVFSLSATTFAEPTSRPRPGSEAAVTETADTESSSEEAAEERGKARETAKTTKAPAPAQTTEVAGKSYTTKGGAFLWFLLSVIVNTAISFAIANRFYKLTKRQNHVQSELRALRRDLEEKFIDSVGGFAESNVDITNTNDDYSMDADGIKMTPASTVSVDEEEGDVYKQWEAQFGARYAARNEEAEEEKSTRVYQPTRESAQGMSVRERLLARRAQQEQAEEALETEEEYIEEESGIVQKLGNVGNKAKQLLGGIFPFDEDDEE